MGGEGIGIQSSSDPAANPARLMELAIMMFVGGYKW
jgi:hypothetical protein